MKRIIFTLTLLACTFSAFAQFRVRSDGDSNVQQDKDLYIGNFGDANYRMRLQNSVGFSIFDYQPDLYFRVAPTSGSSYPTTLRLKTNGNVGVSKDPSYRLDVNGDVRATSYITLSDIRLKENISEIKDGLSKITTIKGISYTYNNTISKQVTPLLSGETSYDEKIVDTDNKRPHIGFSAQEIKEIFPELVHEDKDGYLGVDYVSLIPVLVEAIKEQQAMINTLKEQVNKLTK
ncbi:tail fiber domain-containing protein [Dyadobacter sp. LJ53]|uniref:tail fiber domain-containing protein n=1 Tax=Dyadobacter chenwenxiniae TaxID=2906456 RepID=UPI001F30E4D7|nr:tail fiber domain-containing protein [Dyadobacter chenwenxiniae]MCF0049550.1 tail fiber domain-containing protein [Dyadobacter chenwenxiniae]